MPPPKYELLGTPLTDRELEIIKLLASGFTNSEIAAILTVSVFTIKSHIARIHSRLGTRTQGGVVGIAYQKNLLEKGVVLNMPVKVTERLTVIYNPPPEPNAEDLNTVREIMYREVDKVLEHYFETWLEDESRKSHP